MQDYKIEDGDLVVDGADFATTDSAAQRIKQKLLLWRGEWFLNREAGFPYLQQVLGQTPRPEVVSSLLRQTVINDEAVRDVRDLQLDYGKTTRELRARFTAILINGAEEQIEVTL